MSWHYESRFLDGVLDELSLDRRATFRSFVMVRFGRRRPVRIEEEDSDEELDFGEDLRPVRFAYPPPVQIRRMTLKDLIAKFRTSVLIVF